MAGAQAADVIILCGGLGTRLGAASGGRPKPMALIGDKPFLEVLVDWARDQDMRRFILCVGYKAEAVRRHFSSRADCEFVFSEESEPLGTGGALKLCEPLRRARASLVLNGDSFCGLDLRLLLESRRGAGAVALARAGGRSDGGAVELGADGRIVRFVEKAPASSWINAGIYALNQEAFDAIPPGRPCSLEREVFPGLLDMGLFGFTVEAPLYDIGTPERLEIFRRSRAQA